MQGKSNIDKKVTEKIAGAEMPLPEGLWERISEATPITQKSTKKAWKTIYFGFALLIMLFALLFLSKSCSFLHNKSTVNASEINFSASLSKELNTNNTGIRNHTIDLPEINSNVEKTITTQTQLINKGNQTNEELTNPNNILRRKIYIQEQKNVSYLDMSDSVQEVLITDFDEIKLPTHSTSPIPYSNLLDNYIPEYTDFRKERKKWGVRAQFSPTLGYRTLNIKDNQVLQAHRNSHETKAFNFSASIEINFHISQKLEVFTGIFYDESGEKYSFHHDLISHDTKNTYSFAGITNGIGYHWSQGTRFYSVTRLGLNTGFNLNAQASWVDPETLQPTAHSNVDLINPYRKWNLSGELEHEIGYHFSSFSLFLAPKFNMSFTNIYKKGIPLKQHPYAGGLEIGLRYSTGK